MGRPKVYDHPHFNLYTYVQKGNTYVGAYRNEWDPIKKRSHIAQRKYVGTLDTETGRVRLGKKYLSENPQYEGKVLYYENKALVERTPEDVQEELKTRKESPLNDCVRYGASTAAWKIAEKSGLLDDLKKEFGSELGTKLLRLGIYQLLEEGRSMDCFEEWAAQNWLPDAQAIDGRRISEILAKVSRQNITNFLKLRNERCSNTYAALREENEKAQKKGLPTSAVSKFRYLALDSTAISTYSVTIEDAAYGSAKQNPELKQVNLTVAVDYLTGDVCYACENEGSLNDKSLYPHLLMDMKSNGFDLSDTVLVTDRGYESIYNIQRLLNSEVNYVCGVPLTEDSVKDQFKKYEVSLESPAAYDGVLDVAVRTVKENWVRSTDCGNIPLQAELHLYKHRSLAQDQKMSFTRRIEDVLSKKNQGLAVDPNLWSRTKGYIRQAKDGVWEKDINKLADFYTKAGAFAIRTNCVSDPLECLRVYKQRQIVETAFRQMKVANACNRLRCTEHTYIGKFLVFLIAQSLRMKMHFTIKENRAKDCRLKLPGNSLTQALSTLQGIMAERPRSKAIWIGKPITKKARDILELLGVETNFPRNLKD